MTVLKELKGLIVYILDVLLVVTVLSLALFGLLVLMKFVGLLKGIR